MFSSKRTSFFFLVSFLALMLIGLATLPAIAAPEATYELQPIDDTYTVVDDTTQNNNFGLLVATGLAGAEGVTQLGWTWLKFDLAGLSSPIEEARLNISTVCPNFYGGIDSIGIEVFGVDNSFNWSEGSLVYSDYDHSTFTTGTGLDTLDEGTVAAGVVDYYHFTDQGSEQLAAWLEGQRTSGGTATLVLQADTTETEQNVNIEDKELSLTSDTNCTGLDGGAPILQLATAGDPLAVANMNATASSDTTPLIWIAVAAIAVLFSGLLIHQKLREAKG